MITEITKHINDTNASYRRIDAGDAKNTDLFLDSEHYELFEDCGEFVTVRFNKINLAQAILFISSILPRKYDQSAIHRKVEYSSQFVFDQLSILDSLFRVDGNAVETITQTWNVRKDVPKNNGTVDKRFYFNGLQKEVNYTNYNGDSQKCNFTIRNYLAGGFSDLHIKKANDGVFDVTVTNVQTPYYDTKDNDVQEIIAPLPINFFTDVKTRKTFSRNRIVFGAPGTGKSYSINSDRIELIGEGNETDYERVTFHPDYSYANFVGTYKPVMVENDSCCDMDDDEKNVIKVLHDKDKSAQEQYDILKSNPSIGNSVVPILVSLCNEGAFQTSSSDGQNADYRTQINHGVSLRKYVQLKTSEPKSSEISYEYVPGPFMRMYVKALRNAQNVANGTEKPRPFLLIIEEINRANVAAVFGDVFQLLDRKNNVSEYPIHASEDIKKYLAKELGGCPNHYAKIRIPDNLFIWATMNSADQGVFPMDTAFKRRWDFTYLGIDDNDKEIQGKYVQIGSEKQWVIEWNTLRQAINKFLADEKINEDKQLGPYFIAKDIVVPANGGNVIDRDLFNDVFKHKVLMYLFDDAAKQKRSKLFEGIPTESSRYSKICEAFEKKGIEIFHSSIRELVTTLDRLPNEKDPELVRGVDDIKYKDDLENSEG